MIYLGKRPKLESQYVWTNELRRLRTIRCKDSVPRCRKVYTVFGETKSPHALTAYSTGVGIAAGVTLIPMSIISTTVKETNPTASIKRILGLPVLGYEIPSVTTTARRSVYIRDHHQTGASYLSARFETTNYLRHSASYSEAQRTNKQRETTRTENLSVLDTRLTPAR